ncbi:MAG: T9SS type A sorting domain-containing protein, partial [Saprospiraceae bacterium]|nr:T9SS type A sorting domain-containing protein [Saprospiraceae bacterium]
QDYTLTPSYNTKPLNGVTTYDIVLIRRHLLNIQPLDNPYNIIAADVNRSGSVTTFDLVEMQKLILQITTAFPNNTPSWRFVPATHTFPNPANPFSQAFPEVLALDDIIGNYWTANFVSIKVGDVNGSANPSTFDEGESDEREMHDNSLVFSTKDIELVAGRDYAIPFVAHPERVMAGFQFTLDFDEKALDFQSVQPENGLLSANNFGLPQSLGTSALTVSWVNETGKALHSDEAVFTLNFRAKADGLLSNALKINSLQTAAEAYAGDFSSSSTDFETWGVGLAFEPSVAAEEQVSLRNFPNPFAGKTTLEFQLPTPAQVEFRLYDPFGRLVKAWTSDYENGRHTLPLDLSDINSGILFLEMKANHHKRIIKLVNDL